MRDRLIALTLIVSKGDSVRRAEVELLLVLLETEPLGLCGVRLPYPGNFLSIGLALWAEFPRPVRFYLLTLEHV